MLFRVSPHLCIADIMGSIYLVVLVEVCIVKVLCATNCVDNGQEWKHDFDLICRTARHLQGSWRGVETPGGDNCDSDLEVGWYRVLTADGSPARIPTVCIRNDACGTRIPLRVDMNAKSMPGKGETVQASLCGSFPVFGYWDCCVLKQTTLIHNCGDFYIYWLKATDRCSVGYCVQGDKDKIEHLTVKTGEKVYDSDSHFREGDMKRPERNAEPPRLTRSPVLCTGDYLACDDGTACYRKQHRCDYYADCPDNSDEHNCHNIPRTCPEGQIVCPDGKCRKHCTIERVPPTRAPILIRTFTFSNLFPERKRMLSRKPIIIRHFTLPIVFPERKGIPDPNHEKITDSPIDKPSALQDERKGFIDKTVTVKKSDIQSYQLPNSLHDLPSTTISADRETTEMEGTSSSVIENTILASPSLGSILPTLSASRLHQRHSVNTYSASVYSSSGNVDAQFVVDTKVAGVTDFAESLSASQMSFLQGSEFHESYHTDSNVPINTRRDIHSLLSTSVKQDGKTHSHVTTLIQETQSFQPSEITFTFGDIFYSELSVTKFFPSNTETSDQLQLLTVSSDKLSPTSPLVTITESYIGSKSFMSSQTTNDYGGISDAKDKNMVNPTSVSPQSTSYYGRTSDIEEKDRVNPTSVLPRSTSDYGRTSVAKEKDRVEPTSVLSPSTSDYGRTSDGEGKATVNATSVLSPSISSYGRTSDVKGKDMVNSTSVSSPSTSNYGRTSDVKGKDMINPTSVLSQGTRNYGQTKEKDIISPTSVFSSVESSEVSTAATGDSSMTSTESVDGVQPSSDQWSPCTQCIKLLFFSVENKSPAFFSRLKALLAMMLNRYYKTVVGLRTSRRWIRSTATHKWPEFKASDIYIRNSTFSNPFTAVYIEAKFPGNNTDDFLSATELLKLFQSNDSRQYLVEELKKLNVTLEEFSIHSKTFTTDSFTNTTTATVIADDEEQSIFMQHFGLFVTVIIISPILLFFIIVAIVYLRAKDRIGFWQCPSGGVYAKQVEKSLIKSKKNTGACQVESPFPDFDILKDEQQMTETPSPELKRSNNGLGNNSYIDQDSFDGSGWIVPITKSLDDPPDVDYIVEDTKL